MFIIHMSVVLIVLYYVFYNYFTRNYNYWKSKNVRGPQPVPFFGNLKEYTLRRKNMAIVIQEYYDMFPNEKVVGIYRMTTPCLLIRDLDIIQHIMIKDFDLFKDRGIEYSTEGLGKNLFHADPVTWTALRTRISPIFTAGKLKNMFYLLNERAKVFLSYMENKSQTNPEYDIHALVQKFTVATIFACAFGIDFDTFNCELDEALVTVDKLSVTPSFAVEVDMMYPGILKKLNLSLFPAGVKQFFDKLVSNIVSQRNGKPSDRGDFMDLLLQMRQTGEITSLKSKEGSEHKAIEITDDVIGAQAFVFFVAGYETAATSMTYLLYSIALHPEVQDKLIQEIDNVTMAHNGEITYESLKEMKYLDKTFFETLRMFSVVDPLQRRALEDYKIPGTDVIIKKNQIVLLSVSGIHRDEKYYPNPEVFDPDRFEPELAGARHPCAYLPFGVGPRNCIGMRFGALQSRLCIAKILSKFRVETCERTKIPIGVQPDRAIIGPSEQIFLNIVPRTR
ncbi:cytochrome P450 6B6-like [Anticarsia gemmatalis]|uniref:cytochrome P450 6B6-like n=1 Tax=Anticarsia gemmatalis TaxID=129554 RepID=UPI003F76593C